MNVAGTKRNPRDRKNPHAAEEWAKRKRAANAARPKQQEVISAGGHVTHVRGAYAEAT